MAGREGGTVPVGLVVAVVVVWSLLRVIELLWSEANLPALRARGAVESCRRGLVPLLLANALAALLAMAALASAHASDSVAADPVSADPAGRTLGWLSGATLWPASPGVRWAALAVLVAAEAWHWWAIATLGRRWTVPVVVVPDEAPVARGPYRWLRHPGYLGGALSAVVLPLVAGSWLLALAEAAVMAVVVAARIRCEDAAWRASAGVDLRRPSS